MKRAAWALAGTIVAAALSPRPAAAQPQPFTQAERQLMLDAHNQVRCGVSPAAQVMPPLVWDARLEETARVWAAGCQNGLPGDTHPGLIDHNPNRSMGHPFYVGENISAQSSGTLSPVAAASGWANEDGNYNFANNTCSGICGHYTQMVWASTRRIGCARHYCGSLAYPSTIVCDYGPGGNDGNRPYVAGGAVNGACDLVFADGFERVDLTPWDAAQTDGGDLSISGAAGLAGTLYGLQAVVDDRAGLYVADDTPQDESRYRARFRFDPNDFDPGELQLHFRTRIFLAFEDGPRRLAAIVLRRQVGAYSLMGRARRDDDTQANTAFVPITNAPHFIEIDLRRATGPDANDGWFQMWIDGVSAGNLTGLDNSSSGVDFVRLGALSVKDGASGTLYWDEFESRGESYIGP